MIFDSRAVVPSGVDGVPMSGLPAYAASTNGTVSTGTTLATDTSIATLFLPATSERRVEIIGVRVSWAGGSNGRFLVCGNFITDEAAGGTIQPSNPLNQDDGASEATFRSGAGTPTRVTGALFCIAANGSVDQILNMSDQLFDFAVPIVLRPGVGEGFEVRTLVESALSTASNVSAHFIWREYQAAA